MRTLIGGLCLVLLTACQSGGGSSDSGGQAPGTKKMTLKTREDRNFLSTMSSKGSREQVTRNLLSRLLNYSFSRRYNGVSEQDVEETLNQIAIRCEGEVCITEGLK